MTVFTNVVTVAAVLLMLLQIITPTVLIIKRLRDGQFPTVEEDNNSDPAFRWLFEAVYPQDNPLSCMSQLWNSLFAGLSVPALLKAPRFWRVGPCLAMAAKMIYIHTILQQEYVVEATGFPLSPSTVSINVLISAVYVAIIFLPDPPREPVAKATTMLAKAVRLLAYVLLTFNCLTTVFMMGYTLLFGELPVEFTQESAADEWIMSQLITDNPVQSSTLFSSFLVNPFMLMALPHVRRVWRLGPLLVLAGAVLIVNTYIENILVLEATGEPIPDHAYYAHMFTAVTAGLVLSLPEPGGAATGKDE